MLEQEIDTKLLQDEGGQSRNRNGGSLSASQLGMGQDESLEKERREVDA